MIEDGLHALPYERDSAALMRRLATLPGAMFLDSGLQDQPEARFDILSALPALTLTQQADGLLIEEAGAGNTPDASPPLQLPAGELLPQLLARLEQLQPQPVDTFGLPFAGGAIGYLGYASRRDLIDFRQRSAAQGTPLARVGIYLWAIVVDHQSQQSWLCVQPGCALATRRAIAEALTGQPAPDPPFELQQCFQAQWSAREYAQAFARLQQWILAGDCYQANLTQRFSSRYRGAPLTAYLQLRQLSRSPFSAYIDLPHGAMLSLSPERFIQVSKAQALTQPIKGTRTRSADPVEDARRARELLHSEKDRAENLMIVDLLRNDFGSQCEIGSVRTDLLFSLRSFTAVHHLVSSISGKLPAGRDALALLHACFPGGSITGAPKIRAMQIIDELETVPRSVYCGSVFWRSFNGDMDSSITIRTLLCEDEDIHCWGGGGIVADSDAKQEYHESIDKISALIGGLEQHFLDRRPEDQQTVRGSAHDCWPE